MIHYKKTFATYLFFASSLIGQFPQLEGIRAFGTGSEQSLTDAFSHELGFAQHLTCFIDVRRNIKDKLNSCSVPSDVGKAILGDVFGRQSGTVFEEGLVDSSDSDDFQVKLQSLLTKWRSIEVPTVANMDRFTEWFIGNKADVIRKTML